MDHAACSGGFNVTRGRRTPRLAVVGSVVLLGTGCVHLRDVQPDPAVPGTNVTNLGSGFGATQGTSRVLYDSAPMPVVSWSDTSIVATLPSPKADGNYIVSVMVAGQPTAKRGHTIRNSAFQLGVTRVGSGTGSVTSAPAGIDCGTTCSATFDHGTTVTLTATAGTGMVFTGWNGAGCAATGTCDVTLDATTSVTAAFDIHTFQRTFGGMDGEVGHSVAQTSDGGYILGGFRTSSSLGSSDVYLVKTDADGSSSWEKTFGGTGNEYGYSVQQATDGYLLAGYTSSFGAGSGDAYLVKTDVDGHLVWQRTFGGTGGDSAVSARQTTDGGYIAAGYTSSFGAGGVDAYLVKTDAGGNLVWQRTFGGTSTDVARDVQQTADGGYILAGETDSLGAGRRDAYLVKTDANGTVVWQRTFGGNDDDWANSVQQTRDGGYVLAGYTMSMGVGGGDAYLVKTDAGGNLVWQTTFGGSQYDLATSVRQTTDGGYILAGDAPSPGTGGTDVYLARTDGSGSLIWQRTFGGSGMEEGYSVQHTTDGGFIVAGYTHSFGAGGGDAYLVKTDADGNSPSAP